MSVARWVQCESCNLEVPSFLATERHSGGSVCNGCLGQLSASSRGIDGIDVEHLLAEHLAATAELRHLRARNRELEHTVDELRMRLIRLGDWRPL